MKKNTLIPMGNLQLLAGAEPNLTEELVKAQTIDMVEVFGKDISKLKKMLGLERTIVLPIGSTIKTYKSEVTLEDKKVKKGEIIPLSKVKKEEADPIELTWGKRRKAVAAEDIQKYGFEQAIANTDTELIRKEQKELKKEFFEQLKKGTKTATGKGLNGAMAQAWGAVAGIFEDDEVTTIAFVNPADVADYLAETNVTIQKAFGLKYVEDFVGVDVAVISTLVPAKTIYATANNNLILAHAKMNGGEIGKVFDFTTEETGILGVTHDINKTRLTAETITASAIALFAERLDGIVKVTIEDKKAGTGV